MTQQSRKVVANMTLTLDGRYAGPGGPEDMAFVMPYATGDVSRDFMVSIVEPATTALLGRVNAEGFLGFWPQMIGTEGVDPRDEAYAKWLVATEKVVLSSTLTEAPWENARIANAPTADVVRELQAQPGGDILVNNSVSVIRALLEADLLDQLALTVVPRLLGGGARLFENGLPESQWTVATSVTGDDGMLAVKYDRVR